jgi:predicted membrane protein
MKSWKWIALVVLIGLLLTSTVSFVLVLLFKVINFIVTFILLFILLIIVLTYTQFYLWKKKYRKYQEENTYQHDNDYFITVTRDTGEVPRFTRED